MASGVLLFLVLGAAFAQAGFDLKKATGSRQNPLAEFLPVDEALPFSSSMTDSGVRLEWDIAPEHYIYRGRIGISAADPDVKVSKPVFSHPAHKKDDPYFGEVHVFTDPVSATVNITLPEGMSEATLEATYQGCANAGLCYPPQKREVLFVANAADSGTASPAQTPETAAQAQGLAPPANPAGESTNSANTNSASGIAGILSSQSLLFIVGIFFLLGLGLTFTPCVLPMVPIISALVSPKNTRTTGHAFILAGGYVLGMALTYAAAGVLTGLLGASFNLQARLQSPVVLITFAVLFIVLAVAMFGLFDIQLPRAVRDRLDNASHKLSGGRLASVFGIGALSALIVSPCVSAPLAGSLLYISTTQDAVLGGLALLALGLGMGVPLIAVAVGGRGLLPSTGAWMNTVKAVYGVMLLAVAIWLLERLLPGWITLSLWGLLIAVTGVQLGAFDAAAAGWQRTWKGLGLVLFAYAIALFAGSIAGASDPLRPLAPYLQPTAMTTGTAAAEAPASFKHVKSPQALKKELATAAEQQQPVMLDFYADWCVSCKVMARNVFSDNNVSRKLSDFTLLQIDVTDNTPEQQALLDELNIFGPPAILFYNPEGNELTSKRVLGEMDRDTFLNHINGVLGGLENT